MVVGLFPVARYSSMVPATPIPVVERYRLISAIMQRLQRSATYISAFTASVEVTSS